MVDEYQPGWSVDVDTPSTFVLRDWLFPAVFVSAYEVGTFPST